MNMMSAQNITAHVIISDYTTVNCCGNGTYQFLRKNICFQHAPYSAIYLRHFDSTVAAVVLCATDNSCAVIITLLSYGTLFCHMHAVRICFRDEYHNVINLDSV